MMCPNWGGLDLKQNLTRPKMEHMSFLKRTTKVEDKTHTL